MSCACEPVSMGEIASRTGTPVQTVQAWHYKRHSYRDPKLPEPQWPGNGGGPRWCWEHQLAHLHPKESIDRRVGAEIDANSRRVARLGVTIGDIAVTLGETYETVSAAVHRLHESGEADYADPGRIYNPRVFGDVPIKGHR